MGIYKFSMNVSKHHWTLPEMNWLRYEYSSFISGLLANARYTINFTIEVDRLSSTF